jgi:hypothetical protein
VVVVAVGRIYVRREHNDEEHPMSGDPIDVGPVELTGLSSADVQALGDSVLGHVVRRRVEVQAHVGAQADVGAQAVREPIAAFTDSM